MISKSFCKWVKTTCAPQFIDITDWVRMFGAKREWELRDD